MTMLSRSRILNRINYRQIRSLNLSLKNKSLLSVVDTDVCLINKNSTTTEPKDDHPSNLFQKYMSITCKIKDQLIADQKLNQKAKNLFRDIEILCDEIKELELFDYDIDENELKELAKNDLSNLCTQFEGLKDKLIDLLNTENYLTDEITMELENGVGGNEAMIFTKEMVLFYTQLCKSQNWSAEVIESRNSNEVDGYIFCTLKVVGKDCFKLLRHEAGVHRVQRIPTTDKMNRIHTSTIAIKVIPIFNENEIDLSSKNVQIETMRSSGPGGQNVNKRESAVRILHLPSNVSVRCDEHRTQEENTKTAFEKLKIRLSEIRFRELKTREQKIRSSQVKSVLRSEKIRTYNFPQDRITDHRIKRDICNLKGFFIGNYNQALMSWIDEMESEHNETLRKNSEFLTN